ncbi:MAG: phosphotransferase [Nanoarchaeota archaeon]|nr:phosphotransferase [Nanoarchaeota archaeon]
MNKSELYQYLQQKGHITHKANFKITPLSGGNLNHISLVQNKSNSFVIKQALTKAKVEIPFILPPERILMEKRAMQILNARTNSPSIPKMRFFDEERSLLAMETVPSDFKLLTYELLEGNVNLNLIQNMAKLFSSIHNTTYNDKSLKQQFYSKELFKKSKIGCYHEEYYRATTNKIAKKNIRETINKAYKNEFCLIHGDAQPKNILVKGDKFYILDYEVAHIGDPAYDLGCLMSHYLFAAIINYPLRKKYYKTISLFFKEYQQNCHFSNQFPKIMQNALGHFPAILYGRVCGTYKVEFIDENTRQVTKKIANYLAQKKPNLPEIFQIVDTLGISLKNNKPLKEKEIRKQKKLF